MLFKNIGLWEGLDATAGIGENKYKSSRPPLVYILNAYFNPFSNSKESYITSIFFFSIFTFISFFESEIPSLFFEIIFDGIIIFLIKKSILEFFL